MISVKWCERKPKNAFGGLMAEPSREKNFFSHCLSKGLFQLHLFVKTKMKSGSEDANLYGKKSIEF
jgi:hypothetical protein